MFGAEFNRRVYVGVQVSLRHYSTLFQLFSLLGLKSEVAFSLHFNPTTSTLSLLYSCTNVYIDILIQCYIQSTYLLIQCVCKTMYLITCSESSSSVQAEFFGNTRHLAPFTSKLPRFFYFTGIRRIALQETELLPL